MTDLRYPIGKFHFDGALTEQQKQTSLDDIANAPANLRSAVKDLSEAQLDSHMNAYIRFKLALTEDEPTIKPYEQQLWADLGDTKSTPIEVSLTLLESLHDRWVHLLRSFTVSDWKRTFRHPELGIVGLEKNLSLYAWHGRHHVAHVTELRKREGW
jgi:hypothetical protein